MHHRCCTLSALAVAVCLAAPLAAQRHSFGSSPPTAPPPHTVAPQPIAPVSSGMGPIQFVSVNYGVPAPQALTRQLRAEDDRTRAAALSAVGVPAQYLQRGHVAVPRSMQLELAALDNNDELDALLTVELDQHIVTAVLVPEDGNWHRIATVFFATSFDDPHSTPSTFVHTARSLLQPDRYRAVFRAASAGANGNYVENEADLRIFNGRAVVTMSFASSARECMVAGQPGPATSLTGCTVTHRWIQPDPSAPGKRFLLVSATGRMNARDAADTLGSSRDFQIAHVRSFSCQPLVYSDTASRFEATGPSKPCTGR